jgi:hypothetical protein
VIISSDNIFAEQEQLMAGVEASLSARVSNSSSEVDVVTSEAVPIATAAACCCW